MKQLDIEPLSPQTVQATDRLLISLVALNLAVAVCLLILAYTLLIS